MSGADSAAFTSEIADAVPVLLWTSDAQGRALYFNRRWTEYTGLTVEETLALADGGASFIHPDDLERVKSVFAQARRTGTPVVTTYRLKDRNGDYRVHEARVVPARGTGTNVELWVGTALDIDDRERSNEEQRRLASASAVLGTSLELERTLADVATLLVPTLADWCSIDLLDESGTRLHRAAVAHVDPAKVELAWKLWKLHPPDLSAPYGVSAVLRTRRSELLEVTDEMIVEAIKDPEILATVRDLGLRGSITVPLLARDRVLGAIAMVTAESGRRYTARDVAFAEELARRISIALDNARLYEEATRARAAAEAIAADVQEQCKIIEGELVRMRREREVSGPS